MNTNSNSGFRFQVSSFISAFYFLLSAFAFVSPATLQAGDYTYVTNNGTITITKYTGPGGNVTIPSQINDLPVTSIGSQAFSGCYSLASVLIPDIITNIANYAFDSCYSLTNAALGHGVASIGARAFRFCGLLSGITLPDSVAHIGEAAFWRSGLTSVLIPGGVTSIGNQAFAGCTSLGAIAVDVLNSSYRSLDGVLFDNTQTMLLQFPAGKAGFYAVPGGVTILDGGAFYSSATLTGVTIPDSVMSIGSWAFADCTSLSAITVDALNPFFTSYDGVLFNKARTTLLQCPAGKLGTCAIPDGVTTIAYGAFSSCASLTGVTIPNTVTTIGDEAFPRCTSLTSLTIPGSVVRIGNWAFVACAALTNITLGSSVTRIGYEAFSLCTSLTGVYCWGNAPTYGADLFSTWVSLTVYYLPGTIGWGATFADRPTAPWFLSYPVILTTAPNFGIRSNAFGFRISWATNASIVVEASTTLANPVWSPVSTNTLVDGWSYFRDAEWTNYPSRFYRVRQW